MSFHGEHVQTFGKLSEARHLVNLLSDPEHMIRAFIAIRTLSRESHDIATKARNNWPGYRDVNPGSWAEQLNDEYHANGMRYAARVFESTLGPRRAVEYRDRRRADLKAALAKVEAEKAKAKAEAEAKRQDILRRAAERRGEQDLASKCN